MLSKRIYTFIILLFCSSAYCAEGNLKNFYVKGGYFGAYGNNIGPFSGKEDAANVTEGVFSFNTDEELVKGYSPKYKPGFAGGGAIGYSLNALGLPFFFPSRVEVEGLYSQLNLDDEEYGDKEKAGYVELVRSGPATLAAGDMTPSAGTTCDSKWKQASTPACAQMPAQFGNNMKELIGTKAAFKIKNEGFYNQAMLMNVYYDLNINPYFVPYIGGGLGVTKVKFLEKSNYTPAYQLKLGASYKLAEQVEISAGIRYFGIFDDEFNNILPMAKIPAGSTENITFVFVNNVPYHPTNPVPDQSFNIQAAARTQSTTATITHRFGVYGLEFGMVYHF